MQLKLKTIAIAALLSCGAAQATSFQLIVPVTSTAAEISRISVDLESADLGLVTGLVHVDLNQFLDIGDERYAQAAVQWAGSGIPKGLTLSGKGILSGITRDTGSHTIKAIVSYKTKTELR